MTGLPDLSPDRNMLPPIGPRALRRRREVFGKINRAAPSGDREHRTASRAELSERQKCESASHLRHTGEKSQRINVGFRAPLCRRTRV